MTINDLLLNPHFRGNQTLLAKELNINRGTLRKYMLDNSGEFHLVREYTCGKIELFTNQSSKVDK